MGDEEVRMGEGGRGRREERRWKRLKGRRGQVPVGLKVPDLT